MIGVVVAVFKLKGFISDHVENFFEGILKIGQVMAIFLSGKIFSKFLEKFQKKNFKLYMTIAQSILKILRSSFMQTPPF